MRWTTNSKPGCLRLRRPRIRRALRPLPPFTAAGIARPAANPHRPAEPDCRSRLRDRPFNARVGYRRGNGRRRRAELGDGPIRGEDHRGAQRQVPLCLGLRNGTAGWMCRHRHRLSVLALDATGTGLPRNRPHPATSRRVVCIRAGQSRTARSRFSFCHEGRNRSPLWCVSRVRALSRTGFDGDRFSWFPCSRS